MRTSTYLVSSFVAVFALACSSTVDLQVRTEYDHQTSFNELKTFRMTAEYPSDVDYQRYARGEKLAREVIVEEFENRSYERITDGPADFRVSFELIFRGRKERNDPSSEIKTDTSQAAGAGYSRSGTLILRVHDPRSNAILWEGTVSGFMVDPVKSKEDLRKAVWRLLVEFPPLT